MYIRLTIPHFAFITAVIWFCTGCATSTRRSYAPAGFPVTFDVKDPDTGIIYRTLTFVDAKELSFSVKDVSKIPLPDGKVRIFVIRQPDSQFLLNLSVADNGVVVGLLKPKTTLFWDRNPGDFTVSVGAGVTAVAEYGKIIYRADDPLTNVPLKTEANRSYFVLVRAGNAFQGFRGTVKEIDNNTAKIEFDKGRAIEQSKLSLGPIN